MSLKKDILDEVTKFVDNAVELNIDGKMTINYSPKSKQATVEAGYFKRIKEE